MEQSPLLKKIERAISPAAQSMGYEIVRVLMVGSGKPTLQVMAEDAHGKMGVDDCEKLSKSVAAILDVENIIDGAYFLEVSSPGIDRPLTRLKDFENYKGFEAKVEIDEMIDNQKKFKGRLKGVNGNNVLIETDKGEVTLPFSSVYRAKLMLTDELLESVQRSK